MQIYGNIPLSGEAVGGSKLLVIRQLQPGGRPLNGTDQVELSESAQTSLRLQDLLQSVPDVRRDRIESLKKSIADGTYHVPGRDVARKMLEEMSNDPVF
jgi:flagellar biosynthesis anti-sigma factor FlgM